MLELLAGGSVIDGAYHVYFFKSLGTLPLLKIMALNYELSTWRVCYQRSILKTFCCEGPLKPLLNQVTLGRVTEELVKESSSKGRQEVITWILQSEVGLRLGVLLVDNLLAHVFWWQAVNTRRSRVGSPVRIS